MELDGEGAGEDLGGLGRGERNDLNMLREKKFNTDLN